MLVLKDVKAGYGNLEVIHGVSYTFESGKNYCLLGPNGCGKTTLIRAMASLIDFTGEITMDGRSIKDMKRKEIAKEIAVLSQVSTIYFPYSVYDTVMLGRYQHFSGLFGNPSKEDKEKVEECLETVGLQDERSKPTNHLDIKHQLELIDYLKKWTATGDHSVIGVLHDINLALRLSDQVIIMKDGEFKATGSFDEISSPEFLNEIYETDIAGFMKESFEKWK